jgi:hypothetical protein
MWSMQRGLLLHDEHLARAYCADACANNTQMPTAVAPIEGFSWMHVHTFVFLVKTAPPLTTQIIHRLPRTVHLSKVLPWTHI